MKRQIPHIDLRAYREGGKAERQAFVQTLGDGLCKFGFLTVEGHGLERRAIEATYQAFQAFFALDEEVKKKYVVIPGGARGYTPFGQEHAKDNPFPDLKEFWHTGQEIDEGHPYKAFYQANVWPKEIPPLREMALQLFRSLEGCASTILEALACYFDLPEKTFASMMKDGNSILRSIHYPPPSKDAPQGSIRAAAHEDINLITLLCESTGSGLELLTREGAWLPIHTLEGDIVVDSGDMLSRVTNQIVPATTHRVVNPPEGTTISRYSMPFFVHPYPTCDLSVMERFISDERPCRFPPITAQAFLEERLREIGLLK